MEEAGLLERTGSSDDARLTLLRLTPAGEMMRDSVEIIWQAVTDEMERSLGGSFGPVIREMRVLDGCLSARLSRLR